MPNTTAQPNSEMNAKAAEVKQLRQDIRAKWDKFSDIEVGALKSNDELVDQVVAKYSLDKAKAQSEVTALLKGRQI
jgi:uncharacterized protein YciU (UPF0263 family)